MEELSEYDNLIGAMGALFYTSKRMGEIMPCIFQSWKEIAFESKAKKIRTLLTNDKKLATTQIQNQLLARGTFESTDQALMVGPGG